MKNESAVQFATESRIHMGLAVSDLEKSIAFYRTLFGQEPTKTRPRYAKFEVAEPPVNLSLNEVGGVTGPNNPVAHFGIQVKSTDAVKLVADRLAEAGLKTSTEENVTCCYAVQNKVWATDPDGNKWEVYVVLDNDGAHHRSSQSACCGSHSFHIHTLEPVQRHRRQLIDVAPIASKTGQGAAAAHVVAGLGGVVFGYVVESDDQRPFFLEDIEAADDELCFVSLFDKWADGPLSLVGEGDGLVPSDRGRVVSSFRRTGESRPKARKMAAVTAEPAIITRAGMSRIDFI